MRVNLEDWRKSFADCNDMELKGAFVDDGGQMDLWAKLGYPHQSNVGYSIVMLKDKKL